MKFPGSHLRADSAALTQREASAIRGRRLGRVVGRFLITLTRMSKIAPRISGRALSKADQNSRSSRRAESAIVGRITVMTRLAKSGRVASFGIPDMMKGPLK